MNLVCSKYTLDYELTSKGQLVVAFQSIPYDSPAKLLDSLKSKEPAVYAIPQSEIHKLTVYENIINFQGKKNRDKELFRILISTNLIPLLIGVYKSKGKLESSVRAFLRRWNTIKPEKANKNNAFILGTDENLLIQIMKEQDTDHPLLEKLHNIIYKLAALKKESSKRVVNASPKAEELKNVLLGSSEAMDFVRDRIIQSGRHSRNILLLGETGTGKSMVARLIHNYSSRKNQPFVTFACGSVTGTLFEAELYGHVKNTFTNAISDRKGLWQQAGEGTLFFDEIGDLPLYQQAKILVAIGRKVIRPVGSDEEIPVNARLIFATNRDLFAMVKKGSFREDLYWRIRELPVVMPPLKKQKDAIKDIAVKLWENIAREPEDDPLSDQILDQLERVNWTGNVRALKAVLNGLYYWNIDKHTKDIQDLNIVLGQLQLKTDETCSLCTPELSGNTVDMNQVRCMRHLKNTEEWLLACTKLFEPFVMKLTNADDLENLEPIVLTHRLEEGKKQIAEPFLFGNKELFMRVHNLQGKLVYFHNLITERLWLQAHEYLTGEFSEDLDQTHDLVIEAVLAGY